ncbi:MAG: ABC transporter ATP-binding protein, partial [Asticcacaulis sp.]
SDLQFDHVDVSLGGHVVVHDLTAALSPGRMHIVVGPNGAGKSTLMKAAAALLPLSGGTVRLGAAEVAKLSVTARADAIAYLPQDRGIAWDLSCVDVAALGASHLPPEAARAAALAELQALGMGELAGRGVFSLSGGQRARVLLARVLVAKANILLLDEPLIALDPAWQRQVLLRLKAKAAAGKTVLLSLHDLHLTAQFADEVLLMHKGRLVKKASPENVFTRNLLSEVFNLMGELVRDGGQKVLKLENQPLLYQPV